LQKTIYFDAADKLLVLKGAFNEAEFETLSSLSADPDYRKAVTTLFAHCRDWVESLLGYSQKTLVEHPHLLFQRVHTDDADRLISYLKDPSQRAIDLRIITPRDRW